MAIEQRTKVDPVTFSIITSAYINLVDEMVNTVKRSCMSLAIWVGDFSGGLMNSDGDLVAMGTRDISVHVGAIQPSTKATIEDFREGEDLPRRRLRLQRSLQGRHPPPGHDLHQTRLLGRRAGGLHRHQGPLVGRGRLDPRLHERACRRDLQGGPAGAPDEDHRARRAQARRRKADPLEPKARRGVRRRHAGSDRRDQDWRDAPTPAHREVRHRDGSRLLRGEPGHQRARADRRAPAVPGGHLGGRGLRGLRPQVSRARARQGAREDDPDSQPHPDRLRRQGLRTGHALGYERHEGILVRRPSLGDQVRLPQASAERGLAARDLGRVP